MPYFVGSEFGVVAFLNSEIFSDIFCSSAAKKGYGLNAIIFSYLLRLHNHS